MKIFKSLLISSILIFNFEEGFTRNCKKGYAANEKILVVISFDGLRRNYINSTVTPYLAQLQDKGVTANFESLRFANSLNVHQTIVTGYYPVKHGVFGHEWFERKEEGKVRKLQTYEATQYENKLARGNNALPIWTLNDMNGGTSGCWMWPGCEFRYGPDNEAPVYTHKFEPEETYEKCLEEVITWMNESITFNPPNLVMIYFRQPDFFAHIYGPNSPKLDDELKKLDQFTKNFTDKLKQLPFTRLNKKLYESVNIVFLSDHRVTEILYQDILDIRAQGICTDVKFYGSDVWLQQAYISRENGTDPFLHMRYNGEFQYDGENTLCTNTYCHRLFPKTIDRAAYCLKNDDGLLFYHKFFSCWQKYYNFSKCVESIREKNRPPTFYLYAKSFPYVDYPHPVLANFTIFLADVNHTWNLFMDKNLTLVFAAYGEKLNPRIEKWTTDYKLDVNECTTFGVHGYYPNEIGYFMATGPAFIKKTYYEKEIKAVDLCSLFAKVLLIPLKTDKDGDFSRVKPLLLDDTLRAALQKINWTQHLKLIFICSIIHCAVFYIAVEIYLARIRRDDDN